LRSAPRCTLRRWPQHTASTMPPSMLGFWGPRRRRTTPPRRLAPDSSGRGSPGRPARRLVRPPEPLSPLRVAGRGDRRMADVPASRRRRRRRIIGAALPTSPNLRIKPQTTRSGRRYRQLGVEVYGGAAWKCGIGPRPRPVRSQWTCGGPSPGLRARPASTRGEALLVDTDAVQCPAAGPFHSDAGVNENGLKINPQQHLAPGCGVGAGSTSRASVVLADAL